jgi:hypothetical protein
LWLAMSASRSTPLAREPPAAADPRKISAQYLSKIGNVCYTFLWFAGSNFLLAGKERKERLGHFAHDSRRERIFSIWIRRKPLKRPVSDE